MIDSKASTAATVKKASLLSLLVGMKDSAFLVRDS